MVGRPIAVGSSILGFCLLLELSARLFLFGLAGLDPQRVDSVKLLWETRLLRSSPIPGLEYEFKPNLSGFHHLAPLHTNSRGLRDIEYTLAKPFNSFRVAVVGSSFTVPSGVAIEHAFHSLLEDRLSNEFTPTRYEFMNFAVDAHRPSQILRMLEGRALAYNPDLILVGASPGATRLFLRAWNGQPTKLRVSPVSHPVFDSFFLKLVESRRRADKPKPVGQVPKRPENPTVIERLGRIRAQTGIPVVIVRLSFSATEPLPVEVAVRKQAEADGLYFVDTSTSFRGTDPRDFWIHGLNSHPNARANAIFADVVDEFLRANRLLGN